MDLYGLEVDFIVLDSQLLGLLEQHNIQQWINLSTSSYILGQYIYLYNLSTIFPTPKCQQSWKYKPPLPIVLFLPLTLTSSPPYRLTHLGYGDNPYYLHLTLLDDLSIVDTSL
jgi:hypothetical protein